ncbi:hypothetical protein BDV98DRAFT_642823 [Pterulicium gracile]|uniref:DUF6535 domain-containing protein n=1 Tax=Pterulicium gracile TaxID=1884261 RepID=A0A5C3Q0X7_9AGAR|nr:hypothetical protein BDV98DRAFT_642823 [Pterula gracilis]
MWFISLAFALSTALHSVLVKQWIQAYMAPTFGTPHSQSRLHHFRCMGIKEWHVPLIAGLLPILLHVSLLLFFVGLAILLFTLDHVTSAFVAIISVLAYSTYVVTNVLPVWYPQCPYKTPLSSYAYIAARAFGPILRWWIQLLLIPLQVYALYVYRSIRSRLHQIRSAFSILWDLYLSGTPIEHTTVRQQPKTFYQPGSHGHTRAFKLIIKELGRRPLSCQDLSSPLPSPSNASCTRLPQ